MQTRIDTTHDAAFARTPDKWPIFPVLPLKHQRDKDEQHGGRKLGVMFAGQQTTVYIGTLGLTDWEHAPKQEYATVAEVFNDWLVD